VKLAIALSLAIAAGGFAGVAQTGDSDVHAPVVLAVPVRGVQAELAAGIHELTIDHTGFPLGVTRLSLIKAADGTATIVLWQGQRVTWATLNGAPPTEPPTADTPLDQVRAAFGAEGRLDVYEIHLKRLRLGLKVPPELDMGKAHEFIFDQLVLLLGDDGDRWKPWTDQVMIPPAGTTIEEYTVIVDAARKGLGE